VVGAGIAGLATATAVMERGATVTVYERAAPGEGQSGGESRIFRHLHDDPRLIALAREARVGWRAWEERFGVELLAADGVVALGPRAQERLAVMRAAGAEVRVVDADEVAERLPLLAAVAPWDQSEGAERRPLPGADGSAEAPQRRPLPGADDSAEAPQRLPRPAAGDSAEAPGGAVLDEDGGVIRTRAAVAALAGGLGGALVAEEVMAMRPTPHGTVEVRTAGAVAEHGSVVVCAGRETPRLAATVGLALPVAEAAHVRLTFAVRGGRASGRLACLLDGRGEPSAYGDPLPGNRQFAVGLGDVPVRPGGGPLDPEAFAAMGARIAAYVQRVLPGLSPAPVAARHCWVTALPWSHDAIAVWQRDGMTFLVGNNLFKHAPALGRALARAALGEGLHDDLKPEARLGAPGQTSSRVRST
jgi:sarcosine oxidase